MNTPLTRTTLDEKVKEIISHRSKKFAVANEIFNTIKETFGNIEIPSYERKWSWKTLRYVKALVYKKLQITLRPFDEDTYEITIEYDPHVDSIVNKSKDLLITPNILNGTVNFEMYECGVITKSTLEMYIKVVFNDLAYYIAENIPPPQGKSL